MTDNPNKEPDTRGFQEAKDEPGQREKQRTEELARANEALSNEIRECKQYWEAIQLANLKLNTLSSITRHDILNQITALIMYLSVVKEMTTDPLVRENLDKIEQITQLILKQIRFTQDYQKIGTLAPRWQDVRKTIEHAIADIRPGNVDVVIDIDGLEIYADLLLERVFFNLVDNSLRHGEKVTRIRFSAKTEENRLLIICEDDGSGIPDHAKEKIFRRQYFRNTGYGLFLVTEILTITGLSIQETGRTGIGARFEISIPNGAFRISGQIPAHEKE